jgi:hypothetical protein
LKLFYLNKIKIIFNFKLLEFRDIIAKKLGLEVQTLNLADYEIISNIEKKLKPMYFNGIYVDTNKQPNTECNCMSSSSYH